MPVAEVPKRLAKQTCPLCGAEQDVILNGFRGKDTEGQQFELDLGYSFCNCRNIFFTSWSNMKPAVYDPDYHKKYDTPVIRKALRHYVEVYGGLIGQHLKPQSTIVELGAISPALLDEFRLAGHRTIGVDIFQHDLNGHEMRVGNVEDISFSDPPDLVFASHIMEHLKDPIGMVRKVYDALNPGGLFFVAMPDPFIIDWSCAHLYAHWNLDEHHILWDLRSFCQLLEEHGFEILLEKRNYDTGFVCTGDYHVMARKPVAS